MYDNDDITDTPMMYLHFSWFGFLFAWRRIIRFWRCCWRPNHNVLLGQRRQRIVCLPTGGLFVGWRHFVSARSYLTHFTTLGAELNTSTHQFCIRFACHHCNVPRSMAKHLFTFLQEIFFCVFFFASLCPNTCSHWQFNALLTFLIDLLHHFDMKM